MLDILFPRRCAFCRKTDRDGFCADCRDRLPRRKPPDSGGVIAPLFYIGPVRSALHRYKFQGLSGYAGVFGGLMAEAVRSSGVQADVVTWVPCSFRRRWTRGYDHSQRLARGVAAQLGLPLEKWLRKTRHTKPQTRMADEWARRENVRDAFMLLQNARGKRILLIDDIYTTGATLDECRGILRNAGAQSVICCTAAATRSYREVAP